MKKLFSLLALVAAMMFTACGSDGGSKRAQSVDALPEDLQEFVYDMRSMIMYKFDSKETRFDDIVVEGNNLVCRFTFNEDEAGMSLKEGLRELSEQSIIDDFWRQLNKRCRPEVLHEYKYNIIVRFKGNKSRYEKDMRISYREF